MHALGILVFGLLVSGALPDEDYYQLLGLDKAADIVSIRKAFKKIAVTQHPDKNPDDPDAHKKFAKIAEAYDVLKDPKKRSEYDMFGKSEYQNRPPPQYHSYAYYRDQFGIYDDDPLVVTLTAEDFQSSISEGIWFINFYSPACSHCHVLAPDWKRLSQKLQGVIKIGAVNCGDDRNLCWQLQIRRYPTLLFYDEKNTMMEGEEYHGHKQVDEMEEFAMKKLQNSFSVPTINEVPAASHNPSLLFLNHPDSTPIEQDLVIKLSAVLKGLVTSAIITNKEVIKQLTEKEESTIMYYHKNYEDMVESHVLEGDSFISLADDVLSLLPEVAILDTQGFKNAQSQLQANSGLPWLICFTMGMDTEKTIMLKKLTAVLKNFNIAEINCGKNSELCSSLQIMAYPTWGILKKGGAFELFSGSISLHGIQYFAREGGAATNFHTLSPQDIQKIMSDGTPWIIGWLLHGCPPCKLMKPALKRASVHFGPETVQFGTVDCAKHSFICTKYNIHRYPTVMLYNGTKTIPYHGEKHENYIIEFIDLVKSNYVISLTKDNFYDEVERKELNEIYVVEYFAPWCSPCQQLQPEWRKMAKKLSYMKNVKVGAVNCETDREICIAQSINAYPTIRLYPSESTGLNTMAIYAGIRSTPEMYKWVLGFTKSPVVDLFTDNFESRLLSKGENRTWVVMFFAPWCQYCHTFEPEFLTVVQRLNSTVVGGKVDCVRDSKLCEKEHINSYPTVKLFQKKDGITKIPGEHTLSAGSEENLYAEIKQFISTIPTPVKRDEL